MMTAQTSTLEYASSAPVPLPSPSYPRLPPHLLTPSGEPDYLRLILTSKVYDLIKETPLVLANGLSKRLGNEIWLKREDLQEVFSFKIRGAYNFMANIPVEERWKGVITCSAGNHAQGVALSGAQLSIPCTIVMPLGTPTIKVRAVERFSAKVVLFGEDFDAAKDECARLQEKHGLIFVPPYDDPWVVAGQGTIGMEVLKQLPSGGSSFSTGSTSRVNGDATPTAGYPASSAGAPVMGGDTTILDGIFASVGGGGLVAGIAAFVKRIGSPSTRVVGVESIDADAMRQSLLKGERITLKEVGPFADGTAVKIVGEETFRVCHKDGGLDEVVLANNDEMCAAIKDIFEDTRSITEPSGALALAGLKNYIVQNNLVGAGKRFVVVVSGANMNFGRLRFVAERAELGEGREVMMSVEIPDKPGSFVDLHSVIHPRAVSEFSYRFSQSKTAHILMSFILPSASLKPRAVEVNEILDQLHAKSFQAHDISDDELAKSHIRYLVGGPSRVENERLFRFEFPERPGALRKFLLAIKNDSWNLSLFHYRNHGADMGRVLAGIQIPPTDSERFATFLATLGYACVEETENPVYRRFLQADS